MPDCERRGPGYDVDVYQPGWGVNTQHESTVIGALWRRKWFVLALTFFAVLLGYGFSLLRPVEDRYLAQATVLLQDPLSVLEGSPTTPRFVAGQVELMQSTVVAEAAAGLLAEQDPPLVVDPFELLAETTISSSEVSNLVYLAVEGPEPDLIVAKVNAIAQAYQNVVRAQSTRSSDEALQRIEESIDAVTVRLDEIDGDLVDLLDEDEALGQIQEQALTAVAEIARLQGLLTTASEELADSIRRQIVDQRSKLDTYNQVTGLALVGSEFRSLIAEREQNLDRRSSLVQRRDELLLSSDLAPSPIALLALGESAIPIGGGGLGRTLAVSLVLGVLAGAGIAYVLESQRRGFQGRFEPEQVLGVPLLADIPDFAEEGLKTSLPVRESPRSAAAEAFRFAANAVEHAARGRNARVVMFVSSTLGHGKTTSLVNTALATVRSGNAVLLVDADFGNQATTSLVMGDAGAPRLGLTDVVEGYASLEEALESVPLGNGLFIDLLSRGSRRSIAADVLRAERGRALFDALGTVGDVVFVDAPPVLQVAYASTLASYVDALVVVVPHNSSVRETVDLVNRLRLIDKPLLGYLYNRSPLRREMTASEGSMMDILGTGRVEPDLSPSPSRTSLGRNRRQR
jgi:Mrp family chromosome partitioning ATPase/capsular polysaccharide biosynthesis protein